MRPLYFLKQGLSPADRTLLEGARWRIPLRCKFRDVSASRWYPGILVFLISPRVGLRGVSVMVNTGNAGAAFIDPSACPSGTFMRPAFPAASPYVTTVGGTKLNATTAQYDLTKTPMSPLCAELLLTSPVPYSPHGDFLKHPITETWPLFERKLGLQPARGLNFAV